MPMIISRPTKARSVPTIKRINGDKSVNVAAVTSVVEATKLSGKANIEKMIGIVLGGIGLT